MNSITPASGPFPQLETRQEPARIAEELSKYWFQAPAKTHIPVILFGGDGTRLFDQIKSRIQGVAIHSEVVQAKTGRVESDTVLVIDKLLKIALDKNLPVIIHLEPSLYGKIPKPPLALSILHGEEHADFDLVLDGRVDPVPLALFFLEGKLANTSTTPLELLAIRDARNHLALKTLPAPRLVLPKPILELLSPFVQNISAALEKSHPLWHGDLVVRFPQLDQRETFIKNILIESIEKNPEWLGPSHPKLSEEILKEYAQFNEERKKIRATETHLRLLGEPDILCPNSVFTGKAQFFISSGPQRADQLSHLWKFVEQLQPALIVSLSQEMETLNLFNFTDPDRDLTTGLRAIDWLSNDIYLNHIVLKSSGQNRGFTHLHYKNWVDGGLIPPKTLHTGLCHAKAYIKEGQPLFVHCKYGLGRSGIFCACLELYLRFLDHVHKGNDAEEFNPDIRSLVMQINLQRFNMIYHQQQYKAIFDYVAYLKKVKI